MRSGPETRVRGVLRMATETDAGKSLRAKFGRMFLASLSDPSNTPPGGGLCRRPLVLLARLGQLNFMHYNERGMIYNISKSSLQDKSECDLPRNELCAVEVKSPGDRRPFIRVPTKKHPKPRPGDHRQCTDDIVPSGRPGISNSKSQ
jgi:hypothetical protein